MGSLINWRKDFHLNRSRQIAGVLVSHGWDYFRNNGHRSVDKSLLHRQKTQTRPEHLRSALEELGTTFIKLGQILSTRADLLPPDYLAELTKLQDAASPVPFTAIHEALLAELGRSIESVFADFNPEPLASASIGQAHAATLPDGTEVVVKIWRPGVVEQVNEVAVAANSLRISNDQSNQNYSRRRITLGYSSPTHCHLLSCIKLSGPAPVNSLYFSEVEAQ
jgi:ubiquinone biosynthesis protein